MKEIYKFRIKEKRMFISGIVLLLILFVSWFFESYFAEVMFFMDYDAPDLVKNAKEIMLHDILTWERYIDSAMRYVVNFFPAFAVFPALPFLQERKSYFVMGANRFSKYQMECMKAIVVYSLKSGVTIGGAFTIFGVIGSFFMHPSVYNIGGFASVFPDNFYIRHPLWFFLFMTWTVYFSFGIVFGLLACGLSFIFEKEIYIFIAALFFYIGETYMGYIFNFLPLKISESVVAFNTLYSTGGIFIPIITLFIIDVILITYEMKKQRGFIDD